MGSVLIVCTVSMTIAFYMSSILLFLATVLASASTVHDDMIQLKHTNKYFKQIFCCP